MAPVVRCTPGIVHTVPQNKIHGERRSIDRHVLVVLYEIMNSEVMNSFHSFSVNHQAGNRERETSASVVVLCTEAQTGRRETDQP